MRLAILAVRQKTLQDGGRTLYGNPSLDRAVLVFFAFRLAFSFYGLDARRLSPRGSIQLPRAPRSSAAQADLHEGIDWVDMSKELVAGWFVVLDDGPSLFPSPNIVDAQGATIWKNIFVWPQIIGFLIPLHVIDGGSPTRDQTGALSTLRRPTRGVQG